MFNKMSVIFACIVVSFCFLTLSSSLQAEDPLTNITGKVKDIDLDEQSVIVGDSGKDCVIYIENYTQIKKGTQTIPLEGIKAGNIIEVNYKKVGDDFIAQSILII